MQRYRDESYTSPERRIMRYIAILILFCGCTQVTITPDDIYFVPEGVKVMTTEGEITTETDMVLMSEFLFEEIWEGQK